MRAVSGRVVVEYHYLVKLVFELCITGQKLVIDNTRNIVLIVARFGFDVVQATAICNRYFAYALCLAVIARNLAAYAVYFAVETGGVVFTARQIYYILFVFMNQVAAQIFRKCFVISPCVEKRAVRIVVKKISYCLIDATICFSRALTAYNSDIRTL